MSQGNVPGIETASLAMDTEEGVEVVWNEVMFSERKNFKLQEVKYVWLLHQHRPLVDLSLSSGVIVVLEHIS